MAARRLMIVMLLLLAISTLVATLAPPPESAEDTAGSTASETATALTPRGRPVRATLDARSPRPETVRLSSGDQLALRVRSPRVVEVEVRGLGLLQVAAPLSPARFDILARREGRFAVRTVKPAAALGTIAVAAAAGGE